jgi:hypothetical protein
VSQSSQFIAIDEVATEAPLFALSKRDKSRDMLIPMLLLLHTKDHSDDSARMRPHSTLIDLVGFMAVALAIPSNLLEETSLDKCTCIPKGHGTARSATNVTNRSIYRSVPSGRAPMLRRCTMHIGTVVMWSIKADNRGRSAFRILLDLERSTLRNAIRHWPFAFRVFVTLTH